jgi:DNA-binding CsgD family transcriptional regulator
VDNSLDDPAPEDRPVTSALRDALSAMLAANSASAKVREEIGASWRRSAGSGLLPDRFDVPTSPDVDADGSLARAAGPVLEKLVDDLAPMSMAVVISDAQGHVLDRRVTERSLQHRLDRILLAPGFSYAEDGVGTNALGTALEQRAPSFVNGDEHFADVLTEMACAAAPVHDPRSGHLLGAIDLTCRAADSSLLMLPFARQAARQIEERLVDVDRVGERLLLQRFLRERRGAKGPLVLVGDGTMMTNAAADRLVGPEDETLLWECTERMLAGHGDTTEVVLTSGRAVEVRGEPVVDGGVAVAAVLRLQATFASPPDGAVDRGKRPFGWDSLTDTERSVSELVAEGLTNRQAAERLFVSPYTVDSHLRSIFRKLGVTSRIELARVVLQRALPPDA